MVFTDDTTKQGIVEKIRFMTKANATSYPIEDITREVNAALDTYFTIAMTSNNNWEMDDISYTDFAVSITDLVADQTQYIMPAGLIDVLKVKALDEAGNWYTLRPIDQMDVFQPLEESFKTSAQPVYYDKRADGIFLYPATDYASTGGLKIEWKRNANYFITTDTTKEPGIPTIHHPYLTLDPSMTYNITNGKSNKADLVNQKAEWEERIKQYWSYRGSDSPLRVIPAWDNPA